MTNIQQYTIKQVLPNKVELYDRLYDMDLVKQQILLHSCHAGYRTTSSYLHYSDTLTDDLLEPVRQGWSIMDHSQKGELDATVDEKGGLIESEYIREEIGANDFSLTSGRYVGASTSVDEAFDFESRMAEIKIELHLRLEFRN